MARFLIYWLKIITYCFFKLIDALLICIFSYRFYYNYFFTKGSKKVHIYEEKQGISGDEKLSNILLRGHSRPRPSPNNLHCFYLLFWWIKALPRLACEKALRGALAVWREKEGELETTFLEFKFRLQFPCGSPSHSHERESKQTLTRSTF